MQIEVLVGPQFASDGAYPKLRGSKDGSLVTIDGHARYQEAVKRGNVWIGANLAGTAVTTQAGLSATTPALTLYNPFNSPVDLVLWYFEAAFQAAPAAASAVMLAYNNTSLAGVPTGPTAVTLTAVTNARLGVGSTGSATVVSTQGGTGPWGQCYRVATLSAAPLAFRTPFGTSGAAAIGGMVFHDQIDGAIVIPPGVAVSVQTSSAASVVCAFGWEEVGI
jgi:hypothetical protein